MCSKCNGTLDENKPRLADELYQEAEARRKRNQKQSEEGDRFIRENFR